MSQFYQGVTTGSLPPSVPTTFETQDGAAVPAANVLIINGDDSRENNNNGIITKGGVVGTGTSNEVDVIITNRLQGSGTTTGTGTADIITFTPTVVGVYSIEFRTAAFNTTGTLGAAYSFFGGIRFNGATSTICDTFDEINNEEGTMVNSDLGVIASGADVILRATGYLGQTINWSSVGIYTFVGA